MSIGGNVVVATARGETCFVCERSIRDGETVIVVMFRIPALVTTLSVTKASHVGCAEELMAILGRRISEARTRDGRKPGRRAP